MTNKDSKQLERDYKKRNHLPSSEASSLRSLECVSAAVGAAGRLVMMHDGADDYRSASSDSPPGERGDISYI